MTRRPEKPTNIIRFPVEAVSRFGFKRAEVRGEAHGRADRMEVEGQMNLFEARRLGDVVPFPLQMGPFEEALVLDEQGDARAEAMYRKAIEEGDYVADAWCNLGVLKSMQRNHDEAFGCFAQSLTNDPRHAESHYNIGNLYFEIGDHRLARTHYEMAIDLQPDFASAYFNLGLVTALIEDYQAAYNSLSYYTQLVPPEESKVADELLGYLKTAIRLS